MAQLALCLVLLLNVESVMSYYKIDLKMPQVKPKDVSRKGITTTEIYTFH